MDAEQPAVEKEKGTGDGKASAEVVVNGVEVAHDGSFVDADNENVVVKVGKDTLKLTDDPNLLAYLESHIDVLASLPKSVRRRIKALKKLQVESCRIEAEFYREVHALECRYAPRFEALAAKRKYMVTGAHEPTDEECDFTLDDEALAEEIKNKANINGDAQPQDKMEEEDNAKGVPDFWIQLFRNVDLLCDMVQEHDESILKHLLDIDVKLSNDPMGFKLIFTFSDNEFFSNTVLEKEYKMKCQVDDATPFEFDGPEIVACTGCKIDWKPNKNVTVKLIKKKQKHKARGATRFVTKTVKADSFFNFFDPPEMPEDGVEEMDEQSRDVLNADFEIGQILRDRIIPRAVLYFTGEAHDDESFDEDDDEDEELEDEDESEEEEGDEDGSVRPEK